MFLNNVSLGIVVLGAPGDTSVRPGRAWTAARLEVSALAAVHAGVDGEVVDLSPPLRFAIWPAAPDRRHPGGPGRVPRAGATRLARHPGHVDETTVDQLAEACLRLLGVPGPEAARLVASPLPPGGAVSR